jgi:hypothetical protein
MIKMLSAAAGAALLAAALLAFMPGSTAPVEAGTPSAKSDRLDLRVIGTKCSQKAWPYFEAGCMRNTQTRTAQVSDVRIVSSDRF